MKRWSLDPMVIELTTAGGRQRPRPVYCRFEAEGRLWWLQAWTSVVGGMSRGVDCS